MTNSIAPENAMQAALDEAVKKRDLSICGKIVVPFFYMGPAEYDLVNGCVNGYIYTVGEVSMCGLVISAAECVTEFAKEDDNPDLCERAYFATGNHGDNRGECFGYFAGKEKDYGYCERLKGLPEFREGLLNECRHAYYDATGDTSFYPEDIRKSLEKK